MLFTGPEWLWIINDTFPWCFWQLGWSGFVMSMRETWFWDSCGSAFYASWPSLWMSRCWTFLELLGAERDVRSVGCTPVETWEWSSAQVQDWGVVMIERKWWCVQWERAGGVECCGRNGKWPCVCVMCVYVCVRGEIIPPVWRVRWGVAGRITKEVDPPETN